MIRVQREPFDIGEEQTKLTAGRLDIGAIVAFTGTVRDRSPGGRVDTMTLEHYPGMTERALEEIEREAQARWPLEASLIIHRYGRLQPGDPIVLVITASAHRQPAFEACCFLMDWLKTRAPFWKLEEGEERATWVEARAEDDDATGRWADTPVPQRK